MNITILIDRPRSWFTPYGKELAKQLIEDGHAAELVHEHDNIPEGECLFILSCEQILKPDVLRRSKHNIVIHASKLPEGRGFAPLAWQILEGRNDIWVTVFEASEDVDAGDIYFQEPVHFEGHELHDELRNAIGKKTLELARRFVDEYPVSPVPQEGETTWYPRRTPKDSELDPAKSINEVFNQLRVASNSEYPAFFKKRINGKEYTYILKIEKQDNT